MLMYQRVTFYTSGFWDSHSLATEGLLRRTNRRGATKGDGVASAPTTEVEASVVPPVRMPK